MNLLISEYIKLIELHGTNINIPVNKKNKDARFYNKVTENRFFFNKENREHC